MRLFGLVLDTNLLILLIAGRTNPDIIGRHKNLDAYSRSDHDVLEQIVRSASHLLVTPHILTETSNLLAQTSEPDRRSLLEFLATFIRDPQSLRELRLPSRHAATRSEFARLGLTDTALLVEHETEYTLLTADQRLFVACAAAGRKALYFPSLKDE